MDKTCDRCSKEGATPCCDYSGKCEAPSGERGITNCVHCGKELHEKDGEWWTWDAQWTENPK